MIIRTPRPKRNDTLFPYTTRFRARVQSGFIHLERHAAGGDVGGHALLHDPPTQGGDAQQGQDKQHHHHDEQRRALLLPAAWPVDVWAGFHWMSRSFRRGMKSSCEGVRTWSADPSASLFVSHPTTASNLSF